MKPCRLLLIFVFNICLSAGLFAQNLYSEKMNVCNMTNYCMDCGNPKATCDEYTLDYISDKINRRYIFGNAFGEISFQVLVDSTGFSCVLSHTDVAHTTLSADLIRFLNGCKWTPAIVNGKPVCASVNVVFTLSNGRISGRMQRMDLAELVPAGNPTIYNKQYQYFNPSLNSYDFTVWTKYNSQLPDNVGQSCVVDKTDFVWYSTAKGLARFDGRTFMAVNETNSPFTSTTAVHDIAVDKNNNVWMYANKAIYMYSNKNNKWQLFDSTHVSIAAGYHIIVNPAGEIFFTNKKGLLIFRDDKMRLIDRQAVEQLPSNDVFYAYFDTRERLWIGTTRGSIMIDKKQKVTAFNSSNTPLKDICITGVTEDEHGNMYFSLHDYKKTDPDNDNEGIAVMSADGKWAHYNDKNSGMPANQVNNIFYDKFEHVLWVGTHQAGLVRFDLKNGWENYHNNNSMIPGFDIYQIAQDSKGVIYAATANGMIRITKK